MNQMRGGAEFFQQPIVQQMGFIDDDDQARTVGVQIADGGGEFQPEFLFAEP